MCSFGYGRCRSLLLRPYKYPLKFLLSFYIEILMVAGANSCNGNKAREEGIAFHPSASSETRFFLSAGCPKLSRHPQEAGFSLRLDLLYALLVLSGVEVCPTCTERSRSMLYAYLLLFLPIHKLLNWWHRSTISASGASMERRSG